MQVVATAGGVQFEACGGAVPFMMGGRQVRSAEVKAGERILLVDAGDLPPLLTAGSNQPEDPDLVRLPLDLPTLERRAVEAALRVTGGNRLRAAALLNVNRSSLYNKPREYGM